MRSLGDAIILLLLLFGVVMIGRALYVTYKPYEPEPTIIVESVEFNESCRATRMFVVDMKGYPLRVFDCSE